MTEANTYSGTATDVALPDGTVAEKGCSGRPHDRRRSL